MQHKMKLKPEPFSMIRSGQKTYELRLYDAKRRQLNINDEIEFTCIGENAAPFAVRVTALHIFKSFAELYSALPLLKCGYTAENVSNATPADMDEYYSPEEQAQYGVVGIEIELI